MTGRAFLPKDKGVASARDNAIDRPFGRGWRLLALWYVEASVAAAAVWSLTHERDPVSMAVVLAYLLLCGAVFLTPAHLVRSGLKRCAPGRRRSILQVLLALSAAAVAAALSTAHGWAAIVLILLLGNALWALELELRDQAPSGAQAPK